MLQEVETRSYRQKTWSLLPQEPDSAKIPDLKITVLGRFKSKGNFDLNSFRRDNFAIHVIENGKGCFIVNGHSYWAEKGDLMIFYPNCRIHYYDLPEKPWQYTWFQLEGRQTAWALQQAGFKPESPFRSGNYNDLLEPIFKEIEEDESRHLPLLPIAAAWNLINRLHSVLKDDITDRDIVSTRNLAAHTKFVLDREYHREISIEEIARGLQVTRSTLFRHFREKYGLSPMQYLTDLRLEQAKKILLQTGMSIKEIADAVGFRGSHYFCRVFRRYIGMSPGYWRQHHSLNK